MAFESFVSCVLNFLNAHGILALFWGCIALVSCPLISLLTCSTLNPKRSNYELMLKLESAHEVMISAVVREGVLHLVYSCVGSPCVSVAVRGS